MRLKEGRTAVLALTLALAAFSAASATGNPQLGTGSLKLAYQFHAECAITNYNTLPIHIDSLTVYDSDGDIRTSASNVTVDPNETYKILFTGQNDRYHCVAAGFHPVPNGVWNYCQSVRLAERTRLLLDTVYNGSSTAETEGKLITEPCLSIVISE